MKNVPEKKTDMRASEWISTLLRAGLLNGSFIPEKRIREFRDFLGNDKAILEVAKRYMGEKNALLQMKVDRELGRL